MNVKLGDVVKHPVEDLLGQVIAFQQGVLIIRFVTDEIVKIKKEKLKFINGQWRINDWTNILQLLGNSKRRT